MPGDHLNPLSLKSSVQYGILKCLWYALGTEIGLLTQPLCLMLQAAVFFALGRYLASAPTWTVSRSELPPTVDILLASFQGQESSLSMGLNPVEGDHGREETTVVSQQPLGQLVRRQCLDVRTGADLDRACRLLRDRNCRDDLWERHVHLTQSSSAYQLRFLNCGRREIDGNSALSLHMEALDMLPQDHPRYAECLTQLSRLHLLQGASFFEAAFVLQSLRSANRDSHSCAPLRLSVFIHDILSESQWDEEVLKLLLLELHGLIVRLLIRVAYFGSDLQARLRFLNKVERHANDAAGHALAIMRTSLAIDMLEKERGIFWTQALHVQAPTEDMPTHLVRGILVLIRRLGHHFDGIPPNHHTLSKGVSKHSRQQVIAEYVSLVDQLRALPDFQDFMIRETYSSVRPVADAGPVIVLVSGTVLCHAIVIDKSSREASQIPLQINRARVVEMANIVREQNCRYRACQGHHRGMKIMRASNDRWYRLLAEIWESVIKPVLSHIGLTKCRGFKRPRMWWCPTGPFSLLPVHAAGLYQSGGDCCSNYFVSSYTPTLRALITARRRASTVLSANHDPTVLLAAVPRPPGMDSLPYAIQEIETIKTFIPLKSIIPLPSREDATSNSKHGATVQTVIDSLHSASVLHLASHGQQIDGDPLGSGFIMQDGVLTVARLLRLQLPHALFAFLSACETAMGDRVQPDQTVHLAAVMMFAGFQSVVGTMWAMGDQDGPAVAKAVYQKLFKSRPLDLGAVPYALDDAAQTLRSSDVHPSRWATYVHLGV